MLEAHEKTSPIYPNSDASTSQQNAFLAFKNALGASASRFSDSDIAKLYTDLNLIADVIFDKWSVLFDSNLHLDENVV